MSKIPIILTLICSCTLSNKAIADYQSWIDQWYAKESPLLSSIPEIVADGTFYETPTSWFIEDSDPGWIMLAGTKGDNSYALHIGNWNDQNPKVELVIYTPENQTISFNFLGDSYDNLALESAIKIQWGIDSDRTPTPVTHNLSPTLDFANWLSNPLESYQWLTQGGYNMPSLPGSEPIDNPTPVGNGGIYLKEAEDLNIGLIFQNGQWILQ